MIEDNAPTNAWPTSVPATPQPPAETPSCPGYTAPEPPAEPLDIGQDPR